MKKIKVLLSVEIETDKPIEEVRSCITRGIYRGLDTEPRNIAPPSKVAITWGEYFLTNNS